MDRLLRTGRIHPWVSCRAPRRYGGSLGRPNGSSMRRFWLRFQCCNVCRLGWLWFSFLCFLCCCCVDLARFPGGHFIGCIGSPAVNRISSIHSCEYDTPPEAQRGQNNQRACPHSADHSEIISVHMRLDLSCPENQSSEAWGLALACGKWLLRCAFLRRIDR